MSRLFNRFKQYAGNITSRTGMNQKLELPSYIYIAINSKCNLKCKMCDVGQKVDSQFYQNMVKSEELPVEDWIDFIDGLKEDYIESVRPTIAITSTEPLLYHNLFDFIRYCVNNDFPVQLTTNGLLLPRYYNDVLNSCVRDLWVSIDGDRFVHNMIRGNNCAYENAISGLRSIAESKEFMVTGLPNIYINYTISDENYYDLNDFMESISIIPYKLVCFSHLNFVTNEMSVLHNKKYGDIYPSTPTCISNVNISNIDLDFLEREIESIRKKYRDVVFSPDIRTYKDLKTFYTEPTLYVGDNKQCRVPWRASQIFCNGDVGVSTRCFNLSFGNILNERFSDIWYGKKFEQFRNSILETKLGSFPACTRCCGVFS